MVVSMTSALAIDPIIWATVAYALLLVAAAMILVVVRALVHVLGRLGIQPHPKERRRFWTVVLGGALTVALAVIFIGINTGTQSIVPFGALLYALTLLAVMAAFLHRPAYGPSYTPRVRSLLAAGFVAFMPGILILVLIGHLANLPGLWIVSPVVILITWGLAAILHTFRVIGHTFRRHRRG